MSSKALAVITARSGSKGLKNKNILPLDGIPLIAYSIKAAQDSDVFDEIFVSTDSEEYAEIAKQYGASVPFLRSESISGDKASSWDAVLEAIKRYKEIGKQFNSVCLLQPTSPLRNSTDIALSYKLFLEKNANAVIGVTETEHSPLWCNTLNEEFSLKNFISKEVAALPRQVLPIFYRINGAIYWTNIEYLKTDQNFYNDNCFAYVMPQDRSIDIDTKIDFEIASILIKNK